MEQNLIFAIAFITIATTLVLFVWQWWRNRDD